MLSNAYVRITNNFLHDMATGTWAACLLVLLVLRGRDGLPADAASALADAGAAVFWLLIGALVVLTVTGALRLFYWRSTTAPAEVAAKRRALVVKHVAFLGIYGGGSWWAWLLLSALRAA